MPPSLRIIDRPSPNHDARPDGGPIDLLLLHYTGMASCAAAVGRLCDAAAKVSAHYLIDEDGTVHRLVPEARRAWHAGVSFWAGRRDINACSIGIELVNPGHEFGYRPFPEAQMAVLLVLARDILDRHGIPARHVLGHSDVAPDRKQDPGELFDWARLAAAGIGLWPEAGLTHDPSLAVLGPGDRGPPVRRLQRRLAAFGYGLEPTAHYDAATASVVTALQRHWRPARVDGLADGETQAILAHLLDRLSRNPHL